MIKEVRKVKDKLKEGRIWQLLYRGRIHKHISADGYVAYDTEELSEYYKHPIKRGRPIKK